MNSILFCFYPLFVAYNHGLALLSSLCRTRGIETHLHVLSEPEAFLNTLTDADPQYVGFSCVTIHDYEKCIPFMEIARTKGKTVLLGGTYPRLGRCKDAPADFICEGEGESLPDFILNGDESLFKKRVAYEGGLDALPLPDYELFKDIPFKRTDLMPGKVLPYYSSRGCPFKCAFCQVKYQPRGVRIRRRVGEDLAFLTEKYRPDSLFIGDELIPYYDDEWRESWGDFTFPFFAYIRADVSLDNLFWLHERGMRWCAFGIESGDEAYRNGVLQKGLRDTTIQRTIHVLNKLGIVYSTFFMVGTPGETPEARAKTLEMVNHVGGYPIVWAYEDLMPEEVKVRSATTADIPRLLPLLREAAAEIGEPFHEQSATAMILGALSAGWHVVVAEQRRELLGFAMVALMPYYSDYRKTRAIEGAWHTNPSLPAVKRARIMIQLHQSMEAFVEKKQIILDIATSAKGSDDALGDYLKRHGYTLRESVYRKEIKKWEQYH